METTNSRRQIMLGGGTLLGVLIFLAILIGLQYIAIQHPQRWDLTRLGQYTLAPQSKKVVKSFEEQGIPIEVLGFYESSALRQRQQVADLLNQYRDVYHDFSFEFVDPDKERALAKANEIETYPTLIIKAGEKDERITTADEETVTNALVRLLRTGTKKLYFLTGHGERDFKDESPAGLNVAREQIEKQNYETEELILLQTDRVPEDASIVLIAGPDVDPLESELAVIRDYIKHGGKLLVTLNPFKTPKLCALLEEFGFKLSEDIVIDQMSRVFGGDYLIPVITTYVEFPITKNFNVASFFPEARSIQVAKEPVPHAVVKELALTSPASWTIAESQLKSGNVAFNPETGMKGPVPVMAVSTYTALDALKSEENESPSPSEEFSDTPTTNAGEGGEAAPEAESTDSDTVTKPPKARIVVFGSSEFAANRFFKVQGNGEIFLNTVSWLAEEEDLIAIRPKSPKSQPIVLTRKQSTLVFVVPVILIPFAWLVLGAVVYYVRRRRITV